MRLLLIHLLAAVVAANPASSFIGPHDTQTNAVSPYEYEEAGEDTGISSYIYDAITKSVQTVNWLFTNEDFTQYDKSDEHDVLLSNQEQPALLKDNHSSGGWADYFSQAAKYGRQVFSATNSMTLGYETSKLKV
jgi:hypothetical protein